MNQPHGQSVRIKLASELWEFDQIHCLNYRTFAQEIPQHQPNAQKRLIDRFHSENTYVIALQGTQLVGMLALKGERPFSLDAKLPDLNVYLPKGATPVEVRLLAVEPHVRGSAVFVNMMNFAMKHCLRQGYDLAVISGTTRQTKLYRHLGFVPFGTLVGAAAAPYQPMYLTLEAYQHVLSQNHVLHKALHETIDEGEVLNFLPGPVCISPEVRNAFKAPCLSHRGNVFQAQMVQVQQRFCQMLGVPYAQVLLGSGTLANEVIAAQLSLLNGSGVVLSNGEFGERLIAHARRAQLTFEPVALPWGTSFDLFEVERTLSQLSQGDWVWAVHHETSTGVLNPMEPLKTMCRRLGLRLCLDCISSVGAMFVDLSNGVYLASAVSGKGLGGYPGLAIVLHAYEPVLQPDKLPAYLDLAYWACKQSVPFTHSSNLLNALAVAVEQATPQRMQHIQDNMVWLREELRKSQFSILVPAHSASFAVITVVVDGAGMAKMLGEELEMRGYWLSYRSAYLLKRNWIQIALLGNPPREHLEKLVRVMGLVYKRLRV